MSANAKETMRNELLWDKIKSRFSFRLPAIKTILLQNIYVYRYSTPIHIWYYVPRSVLLFHYVVCAANEITAISQLAWLLLGTVAFLYSHENLKTVHKIIEIIANLLRSLGVFYHTIKHLLIINDTL